jgi:hypothetical protein
METHTKIKPLVPFVERGTVVDFQQDITAL